MLSMASMIQRFSREAADTPPNFGEDNWDGSIILQFQEASLNRTAPINYSPQGIYEHRAGKSKNDRNRIAQA